MAHWNGKVTELKARTHMVLLAGEDKDTMKVRKGGKKMAFILKKSLAFQPGFTCNSRIQLLQSFGEGILVSCFSVAHMMSSPQEETIAGMSGK